MVIEWWGLVPFILMLVGIAAFPLIPATSHRWEDWRFQLAMSLILGIPVALWMWIGDHPLTVAEALVEYGQFIILLFGLFVVAGGIFLDGDIEATPRTNTLFIGIGTLLASFVGTTGAAMLLIRPLLNINAERVHRRHTVVFTILTAANCGGLLTPLGDPPLFLGMLRGVPFTWTLSLFPEWLFVNAMLLTTYYLLDRRLHAKEPASAILDDKIHQTPLRIRGVVNFVFFAMIVLAVALAPSLNLELIEHGEAAWHHFVPWREIIILLAAGLSWTIGDHAIRFEKNKFTWAPIREVAVLFIGIFLTMIPALKFLGQVAHGLALDDVMFFIMTGGLSSLLDNAPTYATFFEIAKQIPLEGAPLIAGVPEPFLRAISLGAVFCGALTYIGNGPNFMIKSVADQAGVSMPSFGGYIGWSMRYLVPTLVAMACIFIAGGVWMWVGIAIAALALGYQFYISSPRRVDISHGA